MHGGAGGKPLKIGDVVQALQTKMNGTGVLRVRTEHGWVSEKAGDGTVLLEKVAAGDETDDEDEESEADTETDAETDTDAETESDTGAFPYNP